MDEYQKASESVMSELENTQQIEYKVRLDMRGYEVVRSQYFSTMKNPAMTIADGKLGFNTSCLKKFENVEYVELLLNSVNRCIAVRPCDQNNPNAIHWGRLREGRWCALSMDAMLFQSADGARTSLPEVRERLVIPEQIPEGFFVKLCDADTVLVRGSVLGSDVHCQLRQV